MQFTRAGIPVNVPKGFKKGVKVQSFSKKNRVIVPNPYTEYAELVKVVDGLEQSIIGPTGTKDFREALQEGFVVVNEWQRVII